MLDKKILQKISSHNKVKLAVTDLDGVLLGKIISAEKFKAVLDKGFGFCNVIFGWDMHDRLLRCQCWCALHWLADRLP